MADLFSLLTPEEQERTKKWAKARESSEYERAIPPKLYLAAQLGYYYGWQAVVDFRRGYHEGIDAKGNKTRISFTYEEAVAFVEAASKVHYRQLLDNGKINAATSVSSHDPTYAGKNAAYVNKVARSAYQ